MTRITPTADRILVQEIEEDAITASGIVLPDSARQDGLKKVEVVKVGPGSPFEGRDGILLHPVATHVGQIVFIAKFGGMEVKDTETGQNYILVSERDIVAVLDEA